jgi:hypothetical protein
MPDAYNQPWGATMFHSHGQYGSTLFDPIHSMVRLEINICDECLRAHKERVIYVRDHHVEPTHDVMPWDPNMFDD